MAKEVYSLQEEIMVPPVYHCPVWFQWDNRVRRSLEQGISLRTQWKVLILLLGSGASWLTPGYLPWQTLRFWEISFFYLHLLSSCMQLWEARVQILTAPLWGSDGNIILNLSSFISQRSDMNSPFFFKGTIYIFETLLCFAFFILPKCFEGLIDLLLPRISCFS